MRRLFVKQKSARESDRPPDPGSPSPSGSALGLDVAKLGSSPQAAAMTPISLNPQGGVTLRAKLSGASSPSFKKLGSDHQFSGPKDVRTAEMRSPKQSKSSPDSPRGLEKKKLGAKPVSQSPRKPSKKGVPPSAAKKSSVKDDDFDLNSLGVADEILDSDIDDDDDDDASEADDIVQELAPSRLTRPFLSSEEQHMSEEDSDDDVVRRQQPKRDLRGLLAVRGRRGSEASDSGASSNSSFSTKGEGEVEDLFDESLDELKAQEEKEQKEVQRITEKQKLLPIDVLREVPFFQQFSNEHQQQLFSELEEENFNDGDCIVRQGDVGDKFYVIVEGEAVVSKTLDNGETMDLTHLYPGDFFGELVLIYGGQRVATVTSYIRTKCMSLSRKSFEKYDDIRYFLIMQKVPLLSGLPRPIQLEIVKRLKAAKFNKDDYVVKQGESGDAFFMITKGSALVIEDDDKIITRLYEGHSFGEMALLTDAPRVASVKAATELNLMYLSVEDFKELLSADDFSKLLEQESKKIRELRDRRQGKRVNSVLVPNGQRIAEISTTPQTLGTTTGDPKRLRGASTNQRPAGMQQKLKTGKTSGGAKIINNYILGEQIGKGTFGVVRLCERVNTHEKFAIKIIDKSLFKNKIKSKHQTSLEDMRREAAIMKRLNHENVVNLIDVIDDPKADQLYLVQEYCALGAIMTNLDGNEPLPENIARKYFRDLLSGLDYLHAHSIIHRDIKPMNLLLTADHVVKIGDFGAARVLQGNQAVGIAGTPAFMAPELLSQDQTFYNGPAVDLWSCGATLFMLVTGNPPWMADDEVTLAKKVQNDELVFPNPWGKKLSPHLRNLITRLLLKDPTQRMTLTQTVEHEWVTEEGADPLPRFVGLQHQLIRVNSALHGLISPDETKGAITVIESVDTPSTPQIRKKLQNAGKVPASPNAGPAKAGSTLSMTTDSGGASSVQASSKLRDGFHLGDSVLSVDDDDDDSDREGSTAVGTREGHADSMDYTLFDIGKKREESANAPRDGKSGGATLGISPLGGHVRQSSGSTFFGRQRKKMSVVAFTRRVQSKEKIRSMRLRAGSTTSREGSQRFEESLLSERDSNHGQHDVSRTLSMGEDDEEEVSLSAMLADSSLFAAAQQAKVQNLDATLRPLYPPVSLIKAKRGYHVPHCQIKYGYAEDQGQRTTMEDYVAIVPKLRNPDTFFAGVFDGHNGDMVAKELKSRFHRVLSSQPEFSAAALQMAAAPSGSALGISPSLTMTKNPMIFSGSAASPTSGPGSGSLYSTNSGQSLTGSQSPKTSSMSMSTNEFYDSTGLPLAIRRTCLSLDRAMLHLAATELLEMESRIAKGDGQKSLFRTKGGGTKADAGDIYRKAGSTAVIALIRGGSRPKQPCVLTVAWVGDSRAVLCRAGKPIELSKDHKAEREDEKARIRAAGGAVDRQGRLYGDLAVSRAFGDLQHKGRELKQIVSMGPVAKPGEEDYGAEGTLIALPDSVQTVLTPQDEFLILASDGIWDIMTNEQAVNFVRFHLHRHGDVRKAAVELVDKALEMHSVDNISAVVIGFVGKS